MVAGIWQPAIIDETWPRQVIHSPTRDTSDRLPLASPGAQVGRVERSSPAYFAGQLANIDRLNGALSKQLSPATEGPQSGRQTTSNPSSIDQPAIKHLEHDNNQIEQDRLQRSIADRQCSDNSEISENTIIRTKDSRALGAKFLNEISLGPNSRDRCSSLCCSFQGCNVAVYEEKVLISYMLHKRFDDEFII